MRLFPGIFAGLLASVTVVAAFACVVAVVRPGADETTSLPSRVAPESVGRPLRIPAAPTAAPKLDVVPAARALSGPAVLVAPHRAATPRQERRAAYPWGCNARLLWRNRIFQGPCRLRR